MAQTRSAEDSARPTSTLVETTNGKVRGRSQTGYDQWLGIPYAADSTGKSRWTAPRPAARWAGVRDAMRFSDRCAQASGWDPGYEDPTLTEDCLSLNVYTPEGTQGRLPVLVWIHGGGFTGGAGQDTNPRKFAQQANAVVVTVNYRLGALGYLNLPQLRKENGDGPGTFGLLDQQAAYLAATTFDPELAGSGGPASAREPGEALAEIIHAEIELLVSRGVRLIQLNNPLLLGQIAADPAAPGPLSFVDALAVEAQAVRLDVRPEGVRIGVCPGWEAPAVVDRAGAESLFGEVPADRWILPYDKGAAAELDLLRALPEDRDACLGVVGATVPELEDIDTVLARIDAGAEVKDIEDMAVAPSRGFADSAAHPLLSAEAQRRKLVLVETVAHYCWGNEF
ncbi:carboxylesterase family protein [Streptomyces phaeochromogenes]|uniref:carboxylesterase family protein n=1 Tax=Streptomyces phaeochromogenes TaxID=1923 RepID=UPI0036A97A13